MIPCPGTDQSIETMTLKGHTWKAHEYFIGILPWDLQTNTLKMKDLVWFCIWSNSTHLSTLFSYPFPFFRCVFLAFLFLLSFKDPSFANRLPLLPLWLSKLTFSYSLNLNSEFFPSQNQACSLLNQGPVWLHWSNTCCHSCCQQICHWKTSQKIWKRKRKKMTLFPTYRK